MTTTVLTRAETARLLEKQTSLVILTHRRPDGDTLGSAAVLCRGLRQLGKTAYILENPQITPKYAPLHEGLTTKNPEEKAFWVSVDVASPSMLPEEFAPFQEKITLRIDHHGTATSFTPMELVDAASAATGLRRVEAYGCGVGCPHGGGPLYRRVHGHRLLPLRQHHPPHLPGGGGLR